MSDELNSEVVDIVVAELDRRVAQAPGSAFAQQMTMIRPYLCEFGRRDPAAFAAEVRAFLDALDAR